MGWDAGTGAGLLAGGSTSSLLIGIAGDTIKEAGLVPEVAARYNANVAMAYAVTYLFGAAGTAYFLTTLGFRMLDKDVVARCREYEKSLGAEASEGGVPSALQNWNVRAYRIERLPGGAGSLTVKALEDRLNDLDIPVRVMRIRQGGGQQEPTALMELKVEDEVALSMPLRVVTLVGPVLGPEVVDRALLDFPITVRSVVVTAPEIVGRTLRELSERPTLRSLGVRSIRRGPISMPIGPDYVVRREDVVELVGTQEALDQAVALAGRPAADSIATNVPFMATAIFLGLCAGALQLMIGNVPVTLGMGGGVLVLGLLAGWVRTRVPRIAPVPPATIWLLQRLGLDLFIAIVGITSSAGFFIGFKEMGLQLFLAGVVVSLLPAFLGIVLGRYVFKFHPAITLGATCGSRTEAAALAVVQSALKSQTPALGFTVPYAVANVVLASLTILMIHLLL
jgi:putative transport protein